MGPFLGLVLTHLGEAKPRGSEKNWISQIMLKALIGYLEPQITITTLVASAVTSTLPRTESRLMASATGCHFPTQGITAVELA